jgi:hypothetical protein
MPSEITRARVTSCCSLAIHASAARGLCNAASVWVGSCAITIKRRRDQTPKVQPRNSDPANLRAAIGRSRKSAKFEEASMLPVVTTRALRQARSLCEVQVLPPCQFWPYGPHSTWLGVLSERRPTPCPGIAQLHAGFGAPFHYGATSSSVWPKPPPRHWQSSFS